MSDEYYILNDMVHRVRRDASGNEVSEALDGGIWIAKSRPDLIRHFGKPIDPDFLAAQAGPFSGPAPLPPELRGFNWGAFLLNWLWGLGNGVYIALLSFVPVIGWIMPFVLGFKGNEWAWRNRRWESMERFRIVQKRWAVAGLAVWVVSLVVAASAVWSVMSFFTDSQPFLQVMEEVRSNSRVRSALGEPLDHSSWINGSVSVTGPSGEADFSFDVSGPRGEGTVYAYCLKKDDVWTILRLSVRVADTGVMIPLIGRPEDKTVPDPAPGRISEGNV